MGTGLFVMPRPKEVITKIEICGEMKCSTSMKCLLPNGGEWFLKMKRVRGFRTGYFFRTRGWNLEGACFGSGLIALDLEGSHPMGILASKWYS